MRDRKYVIGVDEVGRGPIAGPVAVCALLLPRNLSWKNFKGLKDSKKLTEKKRKFWFSLVRDMKDISYAVSFVYQHTIDLKGIVFAIKTALKRSLAKLNIQPKDCLVLLDGSLRAPEDFLYQKTIVRGDEKECAIALASVMAKVIRDKKMARLSKEYPQYGFEFHKGYGTKMHYKKIKTHGVCDIHRKSFIHY